jgi:elongator complex protein 3
MKDVKKKAIKKILAMRIDSRKDLDMAKRKVAKEFGVGVLTNADVLAYLNSLQPGAIAGKMRSILKKRAVRTMSGIAPVAVLTKPYPCPGKCAYCPTEKDVPQSYLSNEPAVMRAIRCSYDPYVQVQDRLRALVANGHNPEKIELIVIGGTWSCLPKKYKYWYILNLFAGANRFKNQKSKIRSQKYSLKLQILDLKTALIREQKRNEKAKYKIIGLTLETRPDYINEKELWQMRELGCTRVELGVQAIDDGILKKNKRGHGVKEISDATALLRRFGFKVTYHLMPGLPGATPAKDLKMFKLLFTDERFQPDQIKFYPTVVTKGSLLYRWWKQGKYRPYSDKILRDLIKKCKTIVPEYVRIIRLIRDIPGESIVAGNRVTNLRQVIKDSGIKCNCIRCREVKDRKIIKIYGLRIKKYNAAGGKEYFIQAVTKENCLLGFCRLRLPEIAGGAAMIRELHVYGVLTGLGRSGKVQHTGLGKKLLQEAEKIALNNNYKKIKVISGVGVRDYYRKQGFRLKDTYLEKNLQK